MRGPTAEQRAEARRAYESGESMASIAQRLKLRRETLRSIAIRETWEDLQTAQPTAPPTAQRTAQKRARGEVIDMMTRRAVEQIEQSGVIEEQADYIAKALSAHGRVADLLMTYAEKQLRRAVEGSIQPGERQSEADVMNAIISAVAKAFSASREIGGVKAGQMSAESGPKVDPHVTVTVRRLPTREERKESQAA